jgi:hypothetical protein
MKPQGESWSDKVVMLQVNSAYKTTKSPRKILLNRLVVDYFSGLVNITTFVVLKASLHFALVLIFQ